ncbi:hypothetical protein GCM10009760_53190 [Kitasatospora kazusensis]|uniref:Uncharacterized protein n=1 Tax=Kitasatospora kazusensis TaxID=407974 RepID=A0ABN3A5E8_9ACTN
MLTITTTRRIEALRHRADQAETALTDTARRLEISEDAQRLRGFDLLSVQGDLTTVRAELTALRGTADELRSAAGLHREELTEARQVAQRLLATHERTVAALLGELERVRAGRPAADPELPEHTVLQFRTALGGVVVVTRQVAVRDHDRGYSWQCLACDGSNSKYRSWGLDDMRDEANRHAAECRAIPAVPTVRSVAEKALATT